MRRGTPFAEWIGFEMLYEFLIKTFDFIKN